MSSNDELAVVHVQLAEAVEKNTEQAEEIRRLKNELLRAESANNAQVAKRRAMIDEIGALEKEAARLRAGGSLAADSELLGKIVELHKLLAPTVSADGSSAHNAVRDCITLATGVVSERDSVYRELKEYRRLFGETEDQRQASRQLVAGMRDVLDRLNLPAMAGATDTKSAAHKVVSLALADIEKLQVTLKAYQNRFGRTDDEFASTTAEVHAIRALQAFFTWPGEWDKLQEPKKKVKMLEELPDRIKRMWGGCSKIVSTLFPSSAETAEKKLLDAVELVKQLKKRVDEAAEVEKTLQDQLTLREAEAQALRLSKNLDYARFGVTENEIKVAYEQLVGMRQIITYFLSIGPDVVVKDDPVAALEQVKELRERLERRAQTLWCLSTRFQKSEESYEEDVKLLQGRIEGEFARLDRMTTLFGATEEEWNSCYDQMHQSDCRVWQTRARDAQITADKQAAELGQFRHRFGYTEKDQQTALRLCNGAWDLLNILVGIGDPGSYDLNRIGGLFREAKEVIAKLQNLSTVASNVISQEWSPAIRVGPLSSIEDRTAAVQRLAGMYNGLLLQQRAATKHQVWLYKQLDTALGLPERTTEKWREDADIPLELADKLAELAGERAASRSELALDWLTVDPNGKDVQHTGCSFQLTEAQEKLLEYIVAGFAYVQVVKPGEERKSGE